MPAGPLLPDTINPAETALLCIDFQHNWIAERSRKPLQRIGSFASRAAAMGVKTYWIGDDIGPRFEVPVEFGAGSGAGQGPNDLCVDLRRIRLRRRFSLNLGGQSGVIVNKNESDAFANPLLLEHLRWAGIRTVFGCGYVAGQCVAVTLQTARKHGFGIGLITDLSADNRKDGSFCALSKWWIEQNAIPLCRERQVMKTLQAYRL